jgi:thiamine biosynthesis lipoprotein
MGTMFEMLAYHESREEARRAVDTAMAEVARLERVMSHYRADSDLAALVRTAPRGPVAVDPALYDVIETSLSFSRLSSGRFDVTIGPLLRVWKEAHESGRAPSAAAVAAARRCVGYQHIELTPPNRIRLTSDCLELDLGGIGKGYAVDRAMAILERAGIRHAIVDAGGSSIAVRGTPPGGSGWPVRIGSGAAGRQILLRSGSLSTSRQQTGPSFGEIIDPAGAAPIADRTSITVRAGSATISDALSTTLLLLPRDEGERLLANFPGASAVRITPSGLLDGLDGERQNGRGHVDSR